MAKLKREEKNEQHTFEMEKEIFNLILTAETQDNFRKWFLELFQNEEKTKCSIEEFVVYFLNFVHNQTDEYNKNSSSTGNVNERPINTKQLNTGPNNSTQPKLMTTKHLSNCVGDKSISRDLFSSTFDSANESKKSIKLKLEQRLFDQRQLTDRFDSPKTPLYSDFTGELKTTLTPIHSGIQAFSTPDKDVSTYSTPSFNKKNSTKQHFSNRSGKTHSATTLFNSRQFSYNDSRSSNDSSTCFDSLSGMKTSHEKPKERRSANTSSVSLGDFLTPLTSKQHSQKARKSLNSLDHSQPKIPTITNKSHERDFPSLTSKVNRISLTSALTSTPTPMPMPTSTSTSHAHQIVKPKKRVASTRIDTTNHEFNSPAFRCDNNILELPHEENADSTHELLRSQKDMIRRVFQEEQPTETNSRSHDNINQGKKLQRSINVPPIDLNKITNKPMLEKFIDIYSIALDLNLVTNILTEIAYLVNLINIDVDEFYERNPHMLSKINTSTEPYVCDTCATGSASDCIHAANLLLKNINNCIYFGLGVIQLQKNILRMLDVTTIKLLLENERLTTMNVILKDDLMNVCSHKMQLQRVLHTRDTMNSSGLLASNKSMKVFYQQEQDTQMNFPSTREWAAFKKQRDQFYSIFEAWESKRECWEPEWDFETDLGHKVRSTLNIMNHPINMAHMAKLFKAQLILSCSFNEIIHSDLTNIDPDKLNKFHQRFAPRHFNTKFPGYQIFFKDFIIAAERQATFIEQLKIVLLNELIEINDSSYETLNLSTADENENENENPHEYIVKPGTLSTLSVLAKFLGLIVAQPFIYQFGVNTMVDNRQIELRNKVIQVVDIFLNKYSFILTLYLQIYF